MDGKSLCNSHGPSMSNGPGHSAYNGNAPIPHRHGWFCACCWCVQGIHA